MVVISRSAYKRPIDLGILIMVHLIARVVVYQGKIAWDSARPDGQPRRCLDTTRARIEFGFQARTSLEEGLQGTIEWYMRHKAVVGVAR